MIALLSLQLALFNSVLILQESGMNYYFLLLFILLLQMERSLRRSLPDQGNCQCNLEILKSTLNRKE